LGLPHREFDRISLAEKNEFFGTGGTFLADATLLEIPDVRLMLEREA
jgi:hypothetical protein